MKSFDLYLDESGAFTEGDESQRPKFPSQVVGVVAEAGSFKERDAEQLLRRTFREAGRDLPDEVHSVDFPKGTEFDALITALCAHVGKLQAVGSSVRNRPADRPATGPTPVIVSCPT